MIQRIFKHFLNVRSVTTDTRKINQGDIFFALKGGNFNGNTFAARSLEMGASMAVVDEPQQPHDGGCAGGFNLKFTALKQAWVQPERSSDIKGDLVSAAASMRRAIEADPGNQYFKDYLQSMVAQT